MEIGETLYVTTGPEWRRWLSKNHKTKDEIWLVIYKKASGKPSLPYNDAVDQALCYGWIDSIIKKLDVDARVQRYTPRRPTSQLSELNKERVRRLIAAKKMTRSGLAAIEGKWLPDEKFTIAPDVLRALKEDKEVWKNFQAFSESYKRIRIGWIQAARSRPDILEQRLNHFLKMTKKNKTYGMLK